MRNNTDQELEKLFSINGKEARKELQRLLDLGHRVLPSVNCKHFDKVKGCLCRYYDKDGNKIETTELEEPQSK